MDRLIIGVMSRVALGHPGHPLILPAGMVPAFVLVHAAVMLRLLPGVGLIPWHAGIMASSLCWVAGFEVFVWRYALILAYPSRGRQTGLTSGGGHPCFQVCALGL